MIRGSCLCGAVELAIAGTPRSLSYCHCTRCRKAEGVFAAVLIGAADDLAIVRGEDHIRRVDPTPPWTHRRAFCGDCGSALGELRNGSIYVVAASILDDDPGLLPTAHLNIASKPAWYDIDDDLKKFDGNYVAASGGRGSSPAKAGAQSGERPSRWSLRGFKHGFDRTRSSPVNRAIEGLAASQKKWIRAEARRTQR